MKAQLNSALTAVRGSLAGDHQTYRTYRGKQFIQRKPTFTKPWGEGTIAIRKSFGAADQWWKEVVKPSPELTAIYREKGKARNLNYRQMAIRDFLNPPEVNSIRPLEFQLLQGGTLEIDACDDLQVVRVSYVVRDAAGGTFAEGDTALTYGTWRFTLPASVAGAKLPATVEVTAYDLPGNVGKKTFSLPDCQPRAS
jgi:hypothetical protein